jgi:hypothetical protein
MIVLSIESARAGQGDAEAVQVAALLNRLQLGALLKERKSTPRLL